jgi:hypothetical protein
MTTVSQPGYFNLQSFDSLGALGVGMRLYTYAAGTTTHKTAYTDAAGAVAQTYTSDGAGGQYIAMNARGELPAPLYLTAGAYDLALKTSAGATVWTRQADPTGADIAGSGGSDLVGFLQSGSGAVARTVQEKARESFSLADHGAVGDGSADDGPAIDRTIAAAPAGSTIIGVPGKVYNIATGATVGKALTFSGITFKAGANVAMLTLTADKIAFEDCTFVLLAGSSTASKAIYADGRDSITVRGCTFTDGYYGGYLVSCTRVLIHGNRCLDSLHWHIFVDGGNYIAITNNICRGGAYDGIKIASATTGTGVERSIANVVIANNVCEGNSSDGIDCAVNDAENILIANNVLTNNGLTAIEFKTVKHADTALVYGARNIMITGNVCRNGPNTGNATMMISVQSGNADYATRTLGSQLVEDVTIRNNKFYLEASGSNSCFGIRVADITKSTIKDNEVIYKMTGTSATGLIRVHYGLESVVRENDIDASGAAMTCISASSFGTANPTAGVVITENTCRTGTGGNPIVIPDSAVSGAEVYENRIYPPTGQYAISNSGTGTVYSANYRGNTVGAPTARGYPGDYYLEATQTAGYPERWTCTVAGAPATWVGANQRGFRTNAGSPASSVTPTHAGEMLYDSSGTAWYKASGATNTSWTKLTN